MNDRRGSSLALAVVLALGACTSSPEPRSADHPSDPFVGVWNSTELNYWGGSSQTMTIQAGADGVLISLHDDTSDLCLDRQTRADHVDTPSTMTGEGQLVDATTVVAPAPSLTCVDGREPTLTWGADEEGGADMGTSYTLVLDPSTGRLFDSLGVSWHRGAPPLGVGDRMTRKIGPGSYSFLGGDVTFQADQPWSDHAESYIDPRLFFLLGEDDGVIDIVVNPNPLPDDPCDADLLPAPAEALVQAIRSNPDLEAMAPVAERVGGIDALRLDVAPVPGASTCTGGDVPVLSASGWGIKLGPGEMGRLYILDLPGGSARALAIMISAPEADFERVVQAAAPVVDSFEFHTG
jgi:hypothetical protein